MSLIVRPPLSGIIGPATGGGGGGPAGCGLLSTAPTADLEFNLVGECLVGGDGDAVTLWEDSAPAGNDLAEINQLSATTKQTNEINGLSIIRPGTCNWGLATPLAVSNFTYVAVLKPNNTTGHLTLFSGLAGALQLRIALGKINVVKTTVADLGSSTTTLSTSAFSTIAVTYDGSTLKFYFNGAADGTISVAQAFTTNMVNAFINGQNGGENWEGDIAEQLFWTAVINEATHLLNAGGGVTAELRTKYTHY